MVEINEKQIGKVAKLLRKLSDHSQGLNFYSFRKGKIEVHASDMYPPLNHPQAINFFFFVCSQQYGFWYGDDQGYLRPLFGLIANKRTKGSDLLWKAAKKAFDQDSLIFEPTRLANIDPQELTKEVFCDDKGPIVFPDFETRFQLTRSFGRWFTDKKLSSSDIVIIANKDREPLRYFLDQLKQIPGYSKDIFQKKALLLAMTMANRPERFLKIKDPENWRPIVDYHLMRVTLRLGLVELNRDERIINKDRNWTSADSERMIRSAVYKAISELIHQSKRSMSFIDEKMWSARRYCPEMKRPNCESCLFNTVCKRRVELFQPVFRTTAY